VDQLVVFEGLYHEQGEVYAACDIALEDGVTHVPAPHREALALAFFESTSAHDGPPRITGKHPPARLHLVVDVRESNQPSEATEGPWLMSRT
jgi:hypothetical protein